MKTRSKQAEKTRTHQPSSGDLPSPDGLPSDRFPTAEELNAFLGDQLSTIIDMEIATMAYESHLMRIARHDVGGLSSTQGIITPLKYLSRLGLHSLPLPSGLVVGDPIAALGLVPPPSQVFPALRNRRVNQRIMGLTVDLQGLTQQDRFNRALQKAHKPEPTSNSRLSTQMPTCTGCIRSKGQSGPNASCPGIDCMYFRWRNF